MKNLIKNSTYWLIGSLLVIQNAFATNYGTIWTGTWSTQSLPDAIMTFILWIITFISIIAFGYILYAGFSILTAWWEEEKVKKWKTVIIQVFIWIILIWLWYSIVKWIVSWLTWLN